MLGKNSLPDNLSKDDDPIGDLILKKLHGENHTERFETNVTQSMLKQIKTGNYTRIDPMNKEVQVKGNDKKTTPDKEEQRFRSFFGRTFPAKR